MMESHYSHFDVMEQREHWDKHTREIVERRLETPRYTALDRDELRTLRHLCSVLLGDDRAFILRYVVSHFDDKLTSDIGEGQRAKGLPKFSQLVRFGLKAIDIHANSMHSTNFDQLAPQQQRDLVWQLIHQNPYLDAEGIRMKATDFLTAIHTESVVAYFSHPHVWSEIGYAGPAYPRGYVRTERGLTDPWEAKQDHA